VSDQGRVFEIVLMDKGLDILGHGYVVMARGVGGFTVVPKILVICYYGYRKAEDGELTKAKTCLPKSRANCLNARKQINKHVATMRA